MLDLFSRTLAPCSLALLAVLTLALRADCGEVKTFRTSDIRIRDPWVLPVPEENRYYIYGTVESMDPADARRFNTWFSKDLSEWFGPVAAFRPGNDFWAQRNFWAPEVHRYKGRYYMFASFYADGKRRGTQVLVADRPRGPFKPVTPEPITPRDWECLDGTLFVDDSGNPWMVFCHEWVQVHDGEMRAMRLTADLREPVGEPVLLFKASEAPWVTKPGGVDGYVTDGPFLHRASNGELLMIWSSFCKTGYAVGVARSESGKITGPWKHDPDPLFTADGGHSMIFATLDGRMMLSMHQPNSFMSERAKFFPIREENGKLVLGE